MSASTLIIRSKALQILSIQVSKDLEQLKRILKPTPPTAESEE